MDKLDRLDTIPTAFLKSVERVLPELYNTLLTQLNLELVDGKIATTRSNMAAVLQAIDNFQAYMLNPEVSPYFQTVSNFMGEFDVQRELNRQLLAGFGSVPTAAEVVYVASRQQAVAALVGDGMKSQFIGSIRSTLIESVSTRRSFRETTKALSEVVLGGQRDGRLLNWTKQVAHDSFAITDRSYTMSAALELEVEWFAYRGGLIDDSRCFCVNRNGRYFHRSEIEGWGRLEGIGDCRTDNGWAGRMANTDAETIFTKLGGYRCNHSLIPVSEAVVPKTDLDRIAAN